MTDTRPFLLLTYASSEEIEECTESWEVTQLRQLTRNDPRDGTYYMASGSAYKVGRKNGRGGDIWSDGIFLPNSTLGMMEPCFPEEG